MKSHISVTLYGDVHNNAVIKLPGRAHAGIVVQGDTLGELQSRAKDVYELLGKGDQGEAKEELSYLIDQLDAMLLTLKFETDEG